MDENKMNAVEENEEEMLFTLEDENGTECQER